MFKPRTLTYKNRVVKIYKDNNTDLIKYGADNAFPQKLIAQLDESGTATACIDVLTQYIYADGLVNEQLGDFKINEHGELWIPDIFGDTENACIFDIMDDSTAEFRKEYLIVAGGAKTYIKLLPYIDEFYVTHVLGNFDGDTFMPEFEHLFPNKETIKEFDGHKVIKYTK